MLKTKSIRPLLCALVLTVATLPSVAGAAPPAPAAQDARFEALLKTIDVILSPTQLKRAFPDARARLLAAAAEVSRDTFTRTRATTLLANFADDGVYAELIALGADANPTVRRYAIYTAARAFGTPGSPGLVTAVTAQLADADVAVRRHAVRALRWIDHPEAHTALEAITTRPAATPSLKKLARHVLDRRAARLTRPARK
ncbi:MAG: HEAT repeat protein [Myxococcota bacterium]|jgi:HEAT repeat protein